MKNTKDTKHTPTPIDYSKSTQSLPKIIGLQRIAFVIGIVSVFSVKRIMSLLSTSIHTPIVPIVPIVPPITKLIEIDITKYTTPFETYPQDLLDFCGEKGIELKNIKSKMGQAYALMSQPEVRGQRYLNRDHTEAFFKQIGYPTGDAIQAFNKAVGLKRIKERGMYCLVYPFECDLVDIEKRKGAKISGDRDEQIEYIKNWWKENLLEVPNRLWQIGHLDPTIPNSSEANLAFQPPIQGKYRNRFKWDTLFHRMWPTADEWISKMNTEEYHTEEEQQKMYEALKTKFENK